MGQLGCGGIGSGGIERTGRVRGEGKVGWSGSERVRYAGEGQVRCKRHLSLWF